MDTNIVLETFDGGVTREWLEARQIVVFTLPDIHRSTVDSWGNAVMETVTQWNPEQPFLGLHDISANSIALTPHARDWTNRLAQASQHLHGYYSAVLPKTIVAQLVRHLLEYQIRSQMPNMKPHMVFTREEGIAWLREYL